MPKAFSQSIRDQIRRMIEVEQVSQRIVAERLGISRSGVGRTIQRYGWKCPRGQAIRGKKNPAWSGGRRLVSGYWYIYQPDHPNATKQGLVAEHRLVMEKKLGRYLKRAEVVHHKDANPQNNKPGNLEVFPTNADHLRHELTGRVPNWTPEGVDRILAGVRKKRPRRNAKRRQSESGDGQPPQSRRNES